MNSVFGDILDKRLFVYLDDLFGVLRLFISLQWVSGVALMDLC